MSFKFYKTAMSVLLISTITVTTTEAAIGQLTTVASVNVVSAQQLKNFSQVENIFNEYQYEMDGWDGSNVYTKKDADQRLTSNLNNVIASGISAEEIQAVMENRIINPAKKNEYRQVVESLKIQNASNEKIAKATISFMSDSSA
ncbi:MAG: hypothetical protein PHY93_21610, partial [Bacteriovorax sp.]|nr:hypothetical protein [Bacteriovorax sp.]